MSPKTWNCIQNILANVTFSIGLGGLLFAVVFHGELQQLDMSDRLLFAAMMGFGVLVGRLWPWLTRGSTEE